MEGGIRREVDFEPAWFWRTLILAAYYLGLRIGTLMALRYSYLIESDGRMVLDVPAEAVSKTSKAFVRGLPAPLAVWIEAGRTDRDLIFPWYTWPSQSSQGWLQRQHKRLVIRAGVRQFQFHGYRKAHGSLLWTHDPAVAQESLDHSHRSVTAKHYASKRAKREYVARAVDQLPSPLPPDLLPG